MRKASKSLAMAGMFVGLLFLVAGGSMFPRNGTNAGWWLVIIGGAFLVAGYCEYRLATEQAEEQHFKD